MPADPSVLAELHGRLLGQLKALTTGPEWLAFLASSRQFHRYSPHNQLLLAMQGATGHVAGYARWQRIPAQGGGYCQVRKGEKALTVLAPMMATHRERDPVTGAEQIVGRFVRGFKPTKVFHQGQLVAPPDLPEPPRPKLLTGPNRWQDVRAAVTTHLEASGYDVDVVTVPAHDTWNGRTDFTEYRVEIGDHLDASAQLKTLLHEWAHIHLGHDQRLTGQPGLREVEAESVAYLLCATIGLDAADYSVPYVAGWADGNLELLRDTAEQVLAATAAMIGDLEHRLGIDLTFDLLDPAQPAPISELPTNPDAAAHTMHEQAAVPVTSLIDTVSGEVRTVLAALADETARAEFLAAWNHRDVDANLARVVAGCRDAGFDLARTATFLHATGDVDTDRVAGIILRDEQAHTPSTSETQRREVAAKVRSAVGEAIEHVAAARIAQDDALAGVLAADRDVLRALNLDRQSHVDVAARLLADGGLDRDRTTTVLEALGATPAAVSTAIDQRRYNPATARHEPLWTTPPTPSPATPPGRSYAIPISVVWQVAATGDPTRLAKLADRLCLTTGDAVALWADLGLDPGLAARTTLARRGGDRIAALDDLRQHWDAPAPHDWADHLAEAEPASTTTRILQGWRRELAAVPAAAAQPTPQQHSLRQPLN